MRQVIQKSCLALRTVIDMGRPKSRIAQRPFSTWEREAPILSTERVAILLGITPQVVRIMARTGQIPAYKVGKRIWRFNKTDIMKLTGAIN